MLKLTTRQRTDICKAFCREIEKNGYYAMIYTNPNWLKNYPYSDELTDVSIYGSFNGMWKNPHIHVEYGSIQRQEKLMELAETLISTYQ